MKHDFTTDQNPQPLLAAELGGLAFPAYAAAGDWPTKEAMDRLNSTAFADPQARLHPLHTKAAAYVSAVYCAFSAQPPAAPVVERLKQAAVLHGIEADVLPVLEILQRNKSAAEEADKPDTYALRDGKEHAFYPVGTKYDIELSSAAIVRDMRMKNLPVKQARQACLVLVKRAETVGLPLHILSDEVVKLGTDTVLDSQALLRQAEWRDRLAETDTYKQAAQLYIEAPLEDNRQAGADAWEAMDAHYGVKASALTPSVEICWFCGPSVAEAEKAAASLVFFGSDAIPAAVFAGVTDADIQGWYTGDHRTKAAAVVTAAQTDGGAASDLLDTWSVNERAVLAQHLHRRLNR
jgi:hypothetical protein